jgi:hypothetical protein
LYAAFEADSVWLVFDAREARCPPDANCSGKAISEEMSAVVMQDCVVAQA